jgi:branched-chain amino acid transport system permease protein
VIEPQSAVRRDQMLSVSVVAIVALYGLFLASAYDLRLLALAGCYAIALIGYQRLFGDLGLLSLAQGAFFAIGAYSVAVLNMQGLGELLVAAPLALGAAILLALICSAPLLRLGSHYLALASLAVAMLVLLGAVNLESLTGGANGIVPARPTTLLAKPLDGIGVLAIVIWLAAALAAAIYWRSGSGLAMLRRQLLRDAPRAAASIGLHAVRWHREAFVLAAGLAALGGALYAPVAGVVSPQVAELSLMVNLLAASVIGGRGKVAGALIGALLLVLVPEVLRFAGNWYLFLWGAALLLMLNLAPDGIAGALDAALARIVKPRWATRSNMATSSPPPLLHLQLADLRKSFGGVVAVDGASLNLEGGAATVVIGPNGAGKTTLLNLICGTERVDSGQIVWSGTDITDLTVPSRARLGVGRSFQTTALPPHQAAIDAVASAAEPKLDLAQARIQAGALLQQLGIGDQAQLSSEQLNPTTRRLVEIARAMIARPALLVLDEPTAGMNQPEREQLLDILQRWRNAGLALFIVEHDIAFACAIADRLCCMEGGRIVAQGTQQQLRADASLMRFFGSAEP